MAAETSSRPSFLLVEECFAQEDDRFVELLRWPYHPARLAAFADRWKKDPRPWARQQILRYIALPMSVPGHHPLVKRLFKQAEQDGDLELMAAFLVAFDRLVRRWRKKRTRYEWNAATRQYTTHEEEHLRLPRNTLGRMTEQLLRRAGQDAVVYPYWHPGQKSAERLFSYPTRRYLRRRAWRFFRRLVFQKPQEYCRAIAGALAQYADADLRDGEDLLESWGLVNACFRKSPVLNFLPAGVKPAAGRSLSELSAAPLPPQLWEAPEAAGTLLGLVTGAASRCIRTWAWQLLERHHRKYLAALPVVRLLELLDHEDEGVQQIGAELLKSLSEAANWPVATWLRLLETQNPSALALICGEMQRHVRGDRLDLGQCLTLATSAATPIARMGLDFLKARTIGPGQRLQLVELGKAKCGAIGGQLAAFALSHAAAAGAYERDVVLALVDSLLFELREAAWNWVKTSALAADDPVLWSRLMETPFDDLRLAIIDHLSERAAPSSGQSVLPGIGSRELTPVWASVLVGVHRGGRQKLKAIHQMVEAVVRKPDEAEQLLPVLAVALRSIRRPEMRAALSAVATVVERRPELTPAVNRHLPELSWTNVGGDVNGLLLGPER